MTYRNMVNDTPKIMENKPDAAKPLPTARSGSSKTKNPAPAGTKMTGMMTIN